MRVMSEQTLHYVQKFLTKQQSRTWYINVCIHKTKLVQRNNMTKYVYDVKKYVIYRMNLSFMLV